MSIIVMTDDDFEENMQFLASQFNPVLAASFRARDTTQREALARVEAERDSFAKRLCICHECGGRGEVHTGEYTNEGHWQPPEPVMVECGECGGDGKIGQVTDLDAALAERDTAQAQLAEAVGLMQETERVLRIGDGYGWEDRLANNLAAFLARHTQAEQQEAQGAQAGDERAAFEEAERKRASLYEEPLKLSSYYYEGKKVYWDERTQYRWLGWQARAALATQPAVRGAEHGQ